jgi:telomerase reverse transcriptase
MLGFSQIRLLPKGRGGGMRMIMNLRRRMVVEKGGKKWLGKSINTVLKPVHSVLGFEKVGWRDLTAFHVVPNHIL